MLLVCGKIILIFCVFFTVSSALKECTHVIRADIFFGFFHGEKTVFEANLGIYSLKFVRRGKCQLLK